MAQANLVLRSLGKSNGFSGLTIRSSRVRFAASTAASYDCATAAAATLPGLTQALGRMSELQMQFVETQGEIDASLPLIYLWEIVDSNGMVCCRYVGKASRGANRPRTQYRRNVNNILAGRPYRKSKPDEFRAIH